MQVELSVVSNSNHCCRLAPDHLAIATMPAASSTCSSATLTGLTDCDIGLAPACAQGSLLEILQTAKLSA